MRLPEFLRRKPETTKESNLFNKLQGDMLGTLNSKFAKDIFTRRTRDMHEEFRQAKLVYNDNALVHASAKTMIDLIKGDGFFVESQNLVLSKFVEAKVKSSGLWEAYMAALEDYVITGNGYVEIVKNKDGRTVKYLPFTNAEDIYIDFDYQKNVVKRYIQRVLRGDTQIKGATQWKLDTPQGRITVYGVEIPRDRLLHIKNGSNVFGVYGRSDIPSVLDDIRILETIERSIAVISKYKAVPKKILSKKLADGEVEPAPEELKALGDAMAATQDYQNFLMTGEWQVTDLGDGGKDIRLEGYIDYLKRKITVSMAPEFLIHGQEVNRATSREQKQTYFLRISSMRQNPENVMTEELLRFLSNELRNDPLMTGTFMFKNGEYDIILPEEREQMTLNRFTTGIITLAEARKELNLPDIEDTEVFQWEITQSQQPALGFEKLKDEKKSD